MAEHKSVALVRHVPPGGEQMVALSELFAGRGDAETLVRIRSEGTRPPWILVDDHSGDVFAFGGSNDFLSGIGKKLVR